MSGKFRYLFGPVPSRRLGRSLGVDLIPFKTCTLDCVFCQLGPTLYATRTRREYTPVDDIMRELDRWFQSGVPADYITLSGSGEPTLHSRFGEILEHIRNTSTIPAALLTNGTLLHLPEVREAACRANMVKVTLSAWDEASFRRIHRPPPDVTFDQLLEGEQTFRKEFSGTLWMEVMVIEGMNSSPDQIRRIARLAETMKPDRIHLNTPVRPPADMTAKPVSRELLEEYTLLFHPRSEVAADFNKKEDKAVAANEETIAEMIERRPCTAEQIAEAFSMHLNEVSKYTGALVHAGRIQPVRMEHDIYFTPANRQGATE